MARRNTAVAEAPATEEQATANEQVTEQAEAPQQANEANEANTEETVDLSAFQAAATEAVENADSSDGSISSEALAPVNEAYRAIPSVKGKNQARTWLEDQMKDAIVKSKNIVRARSFVQVKEGLSAGSTRSSERTPADPTQAFVQQVVTLAIALNHLQNNVPEGVSEDWTEKADELRNSLADDIEKYESYLASDDEDATEPEVSSVVRAGFKLARTKARAGSTRAPFTGTRRNVKTHIAQVFEDLPSGSFLSVAEISKKHSTEYGDDLPSAGAISAALFPKGKEPYSNDTYRAVEKTDDSPKGAVKL